MTQPLISHRTVIRTWPGRAGAVGDTLAQLVQATRPLAGCLSIEASRHPLEAHTWHLTMSWAEASALADWLANPVAEVFGALVSQQLVTHIDFQPWADAAELRRAG